MPVSQGHGYRSRLRGRKDTALVTGSLSGRVGGQFEGQVDGQTDIQRLVARVSFWLAPGYDLVSAPVLN